MGADGDSCRGSCQAPAEWPHTQPESAGQATSAVDRPVHSGKTGSELRTGTCIPDAIQFLYPHQELSCNTGRHVHTNPCCRVILRLR